MGTKELEKRIIACNEAYRKGEPLISDVEYDQLIDQLKSVDPENKIFEKGIIERSNARMEKLPIPMYSLEKIKDVDELKKFIQNNWQLDPTDKVIITPKYDGISLCVDEWSREAYTRGDGVEGQRSDEHYETMQNGIINPSRPGCFEYTFGEAIFPIKDFLKNKGEYKSARNCIAGLFNASKADDMLKYAQYVRYGTSRDDLNKDVQLSEMQHIFNNSTHYWTTTASVFINSNESILKFLDEIFLSITNYKCDGLVIEVNDHRLRKNLGRLPNGNPRYAVAFKNPEWSEREETIVKEIEWGISKDGKAKPVLIFDPIDLCGATVQRATAHNAKYLCDNHICEGATIVIARSGDVIPKHLKTVQYDPEKMKKTMDDMMICPSCGEPLKWDSTMTELICTTANCDEKRIQKLVFFFTTLGIENFGEPTIRKIYEAGYKYVSSIMLNVVSFDKIEGIGSSLIKSLLKQFNKLRSEGVSFAKLLTAYNVFDGVFGEKTCQMILDNLTDEELTVVLDLEELPLYALLKIEGVAETTAKAFNKGIRKYALLEADHIRISMVQNEKIEAAENQMSVCFSGFRKKDWEDILTKKGHKVVSGVSKNTTHLVVKDKNSTSTKTKKALDLGIEVLDMLEFEELLKKL